MNKSKDALNEDSREFTFQRAFSTIHLPPREEKPRQKGLTMLIDWGIGLKSGKPPIFHCFSHYQPTDGQREDTNLGIHLPFCG